jgi:hypothetical protein
VKLEKLDRPVVFAINTALVVTPIVVLFLFALGRWGGGAASAAQ